MSGHRTRIGNKVDAARLAQLVSMPGIDPRVWCSLCVVDKVVVDTDHGVFADVHILSTATTDENGDIVAQSETVRVSPAFAGSGVGLFFPPLEGDEVVVLWPDGNPDNGGVLVSRLWSAADPPPQKAKDKPADALLMLGKDVNLRIIMQGQGNAVIQVDQGKVLLGAEDGTAKVVRVGDDLTASPAMAGWANVVETAVNGLAPGTFIPANNFAGLPGVPNPANPGQDGNLGKTHSGSKNVEST